MPQSGANPLNNGPPGGGLWPWQIAGYGWPVVMQGGNYDPAAVARQMKKDMRQWCEQYGWDYQRVKDMVFGQRDGVGRK